jgi:hypothetical protein
MILCDAGPLYAIINLKLLIFDADSQEVARWMPPWT